MSEYVQKNLKPDEKLVREIELGMTNLVGYIINMIILLVFGGGFMYVGIAVLGGYMMFVLMIIGVVFLLSLAWYIVFMVLEIRNCNNTIIALTDKRIFGKKAFAGTEEFSIPLESIENLRISLPYFTGGMGIYSNRTLVLKVKDSTVQGGIRTYKFRSVKKAADIVGIIQAEKTRRTYELAVLANLQSTPAAAPAPAEAPIETPIETQTTENNE